jgi:hypothetical protein
MSLRDDLKTGEYQIYQGWHSEIFRLVQERVGGLVLKESDRPWFEAHKNVIWYYSKIGEKVTAYCALGRGIDLQGMIHEFGGEKETLLNLLWNVYQQYPSQRSWALRSAFLNLLLI